MLFKNIYCVDVMTGPYDTVLIGHFEFSSFFALSMFIFSTLTSVYRFHVYKSTSDHK